MTEQEPKPAPQLVQPPWLTIALAEVGVRERQGEEDHPRILEYLSAVRLPKALMHDETSWCSAYANWVMNQAGYRGTGKANARSWLDWGERLEQSRHGCIVVLWRLQRSGPYGHVGFFVRNGDGKVWLCGGNQQNAVGVTPYPAARVLAYRWPTDAERKA